MFTFSLPTTAQEQASNNLVYILTTGGTIASQSNAPSVEGNELINAVPQLNDYAAIVVEEFSRVGSSKLTVSHWIGLAKKIQALIRSNPNISAFVITHGTDSMEETAFFLNLTVKTTIPIILVGAMRQSDEVSADGSANLINAVRVGVSQEAIGKGVIVALNEQLFSARDLAKIQNRRTNAFESLQGGSLGIVYPDTVIFYRNPTKPHTHLTEFDLNDRDDLPRIDIVQDYIGLEAEILDYHKNRGIDGMVISSFAGGRLSAQTKQWIKELKDSDIPVVVSSSILKGRMVGNPHQGTQAIIAPDLKANKARILLMLGLTKTKDKKMLQRIFNKY